ncbi:uncharacterized protein LOC127857688 isoform X2 [Dreissena polymorpha]|uniref:uncharacterized protein LOC127857688 isoform X2 n=1 Tax=Dreissena polymorpha TaxID=45954 RepID=UPI00226413D6|nr:uncharacterized protein LOC127857688 isoform X2 [Dreissena polymorpha]
MGKVWTIVCNVVILSFMLQVLIECESESKNSVGQCETRENGTCCLCPDVETCKCNDGYLRINETKCQQIMTTTPATVTTLTTAASPSKDNATNNISEYIYCIKECPTHSFYDKNKLTCVECDQSCIDCNGTGPLGCIQCKYEFNETCHSACPNGTVEIKNSSCPNGTDEICGSTCSRPKSNDEEVNYQTIIIGVCAGGGGLLAILVVILAVFCCRRKKVCCFQDVARKVNIRDKRTKPQRTAMSEINEARQGLQEPKPGTPKPNTLGRPNYENTTNTLPTTRDIQHGHDNVTRYTADPTKNLVVPKNSVTGLDEDEIYENNEVAELHKLGTAPPPPQLSKGESKKPKAKESKPIVAAKVDEDEPEDYEQMNSKIDAPILPGTKHLAEEYTPYENVAFQNKTKESTVKLVKSGAKSIASPATTKTGSKPIAGAGARKAMVRPPTTNAGGAAAKVEIALKADKELSDSVEEDYENAEVEKGKVIGANPIANTATTKTGSKPIAGAGARKVGTKPMLRIPTTNAGGAASKVEIDLKAGNELSDSVEEDYENAEIEKGNVIGKAERRVHKGEKSAKGDSTVDADGKADLEDYENTKDLKRKDDEEDYENAPKKKGK